MTDLFKVKIVHSQSHLVFPRIIIGILIILAIVMLIQAVIKARNEKRPLFNLTNKRFFIENYDKVKLFGTLLLFVLFIVFMDKIGFLASGIIFVSLYNLLFAATKERKSIVNSIVISVITTVGLWFVFGYVFNVTLP